MHPNRTLLTGILLSAAVMVVVPLGIFFFGSETSGMALSIIFLFVIAPAWSLLMGAFAGRDVRHLWLLPLISSVLFLTGMWLGIGEMNMDFLFYAGVYTALGAVSMLIAWLLCRRRPSPETGI